MKKFYSILIAIGMILNSTQSIFANTDDNNVSLVYEQTGQINLEELTLEEDAIVTNSFSQSASAWQIASSVNLQ